MISSTVRKKLSTGEAIVCAKACYADAEIVEMIGQAGYDCVWICLEHRRLGEIVVKSMIRSSLNSGCDCMIRVKPRDHTDLAYLLESGARGVMLPQAQDLAEVQAVVEMMKFPPMGRRGLDPIHSDANLGDVSLEMYVNHENENTFLIVQIETPEILPHIDAIAAMPGVDMLFVGLGDLSANLGLLGQLDHPQLKDVVQKTGEACKRHGKAGAINSSNPEEREMLWRQGYRFFNVASDFRYIRKGLDDSLRAARQITCG